MRGQTSVVRTATCMIQCSQKIFSPTYEFPLCFTLDFPPVYFTFILKILTNLQITWGFQRMKITRETPFYEHWRDIGHIILQNIARIISRHHKTIGVVTLGIRSYAINYEFHKHHSAIQWSLNTIITSKHGLA